MTLMIFGLALFLGTHSVRIFAEGWRTRALSRWGEKPYKLVYSLLALAGFALIVHGYGLARQQPVWLWSPPVALKHMNALLTLLAFVLLAAAYVPRNHFKARLHHPMLLAVVLWALGHLLATAKLADAVLFGAFLLWAVLDLAVAYQRDRVHASTYPAGTLAGTLISAAAGVAAWALFAFWAHAAWIGMAPLGRTL
ncbi:MAG: NnrU family protein [Pseudomonadota bacterium]|nr:NnrU family protein [Pseudomonadota bacterium]